jgi:hypothetical protein
MRAFLLLAAIGALLYALGALWSLGRYFWRAGSLP